MRRESNDSDFQESLIDYFVIIGEQHVHPKDNDIYKPLISLKLIHPILFIHV